MACFRVNVYLPAAQNVDVLPRLKVAGPQLRSQLHHRVPRHPELAQLLLGRQPSLREEPAVGPRVLLRVTGQRSHKQQPVVQILISERNEHVIYCKPTGSPGFKPKINFLGCPKGM